MNVVGEAASRFGLAGVLPRALSRLALLVVVVAVSGLPPGAWAQGVSDPSLTLRAFAPVSASLNGRWSSGDCAVRWYDWSVSGLSIRFVDQAGKLDVEQVVQARPGEFVTQSVAANRGPSGALWRYQLQTPNRIRVQNLSTGNVFFQERCPPGPAAAYASSPPVAFEPGPPRPATTPPGQPAQADAAPAGAEARVAGSGPSFDCGRARDPLAQIICMDRGLSQVELQYVQAYQAVRAGAEENTQRALRQEALDFYNQVLTACGVPATGTAGWAMLQASRGCITDQHAQQRAELLNRLTGPALEEALRPLPQHAALQGRLLELGYLPGGATVDGVYGPGTRVAIAGWQRGAGRAETGVIGDADAAALLARAPPGRVAAAPQAVEGGADKLSEPGLSKPTASPAPAPTTTASPAPAAGWPGPNFSFGPPSAAPVPAPAPMQAPVPASAPAGPPGIMAAQQGLVAAVQAARAQFRDAPNDMARGAARPVRARAICAALGRKQVEGWTGTVKRLSSNSDGKGVLMISLGDGISLGTWENALSDLGDGTLIEPSSPLFAQASALRVGQRVRFSGRFVASEVDCIEERSVTLRGSIQEPEFVLAFEAISPAE